MKKELVIEVLRLAAANTKAVANGFIEDGDTEFGEKQYHEAMGIDFAIMMLTDDKFAKAIREIYTR